ncbi:MAG: YraN family protein [Syntrophales bacterium]|jgi:putative endonuclease|nr:YraN family protein [Syntrophales bacterium]
MADARSTGGPSRSDNRGKGIQGEDMAVACLKKEGYRIVERNYRCLYGEVDIIAMDKKDVVFVEVKGRKSDTFGSPEEAIGQAKQKKISKVALHYLQERRLTDHNARFDVVAILFMPQGNRVKLIRNAFDLSL